TSVGMTEEGGRMSRRWLRPSPAEPAGPVDAATVASLAARLEAAAQTRLGLRFVESPRHADVLLVTGPLTRNLREALEAAWDATPEPKWVVAVGDCAMDGG